MNYKSVNFVTESIYLDGFTNRKLKAKDQVLRRKRRLSATRTRTQEIKEREKKIAYLKFSTCSRKNIIAKF